MTFSPLAYHLVRKPVPTFRDDARFSYAAAGRLRSVRTSMRFSALV
jgi:hypothetical protein